MGSGTGKLIAVLIGEGFGEVGFELGVVGVDGEAESGFGGTTLAEALQDALDVADAVGLVDEGNGGEGFGVGEGGLGAGEIHEAGFEGVEREVALGLEELGQLAAIAAQGLGLEHLSEAFVEPGGAASGGGLIDEGVGQFVFEDAGQFGREGVQSVDGDAEFAVVDGAGPGGGAGDVEEGLLGIESDENVVARGSAEGGGEIVEIGLEGGEDLLAEGCGGLAALVVEGEMAALVLGEIGFGGLFALGFIEILLDGGVGPQVEGVLPGGDGVRGVIGGLLSVAENGIGVRRSGRGADRALGVGDGLRGVAGADQGGGVVEKDGGIFRLEAQGGIEVAAGLGEIAVIEFEFSGEELGGGAEFGIAFGFEFCQGVGIDLTVSDDGAGEIAGVGERVRRGNGGKIVGAFSGGCRTGGQAAGFDAVDGSFGDGVRIVADFILVTAANFADVVGENGAAVLQMDGLSQGRSRGKHNPQSGESDTTAHKSAF